MQETKEIKLELIFKNPKPRDLLFLDEDYLRINKLNLDDSKEGRVK